MKRTIVVDGKNIHITATLSSYGGVLTRDEMERVRNELAADLMRIVDSTRWLGTPLCQIKVR